MGSIRTELAEANNVSFMMPLNWLLWGFSFFLILRTFLKIFPETPLLRICSLMNLSCHVQISQPPLMIGPHTSTLPDYSSSWGQGSMPATHQLPKDMGGLISTPSIHPPVRRCHVLYWFTSFPQDIYTCLFTLSMCQDATDLRVWLNE